MERGTPALLFYEDHELLTPFMHTANDLRGISLNDDALYLANARAAAATLFTLARSTNPGVIELRATRNQINPETSVDLSWTGGSAPYDVHRRSAPQDLSNPAYLYRGGLTIPAYTDERAFGDLLFYSIE